MDITKKNRSDLKSYFVKNSIPTESNFADLIDGMLNQKDDGIVKLPGDPLSIESAGESTGLQKVINFYAKLQDANPVWSLLLNPRTDPNTPATANPGFCVADGAGAPRLFIDKTNGNIGIGTIKPGAQLDIAQAARTGAHPTAIKGLYITGDFGDAQDGVEIRHSNGTQGIGFGYNTIYATGSNANQDLQLKSKGSGVVRVVGAANISNGSGYANSQNYMSSGSLTIGGINANYGGGTRSWNANTAGLLLETAANTEIAVHDAHTRLASLMYYEGDATNRITIGRNMGDGVTPVNIAGNLTMAGNVSLGGFTGADAEEWPKVTWYRDVDNSWDEGLIKYSSGRGFFGRTGFGIHLHSKRAWTFFSTGWDPLLGIEGGTGNTQIKGILSVPSGIRIDGNRSTHIETDGAFYRLGGQSYINVDDNLYIRQSNGNIRMHFDVSSGTLKTDILRLGDKWRLSGIGDHEANDEWLRLKNAANTGYYGGFAASKLWSSSGTLSGSDERLKQGIKNLDKVLDKIVSLRGVSFKWKDAQASPSSQIGLIAQEVETLFPELVENGPEGMKGINYSGFIAILIEALKEQQSQIQQLFAMVKTDVAVK